MEVDGREVTGLRVRSAPPWQTVILGEGPSATSDPHQPLLGGRSGRFLAEIAGLPPHRFGFLLRCVNLLPVTPPERQKARLLRSAADRLRPSLDGRRVIVLGRRVAAALRLEQPFWAWRDVGLFDAVVMPHPSGENRAWGDAQTRALATDLLRGECRRAAEGARQDLTAADASLAWLDALLGQSSG